MISELYPVNNEIRRAQLLDGLWRFRFDPRSEGEEAGWAQKGLPDPISMPVPASFADVFTEAWQRDYCGDFWYETDVYVQEIQQDQQLFIRFGSITHRCRVFINGQPAGEHEGGFLPVVVDAGAFLRQGRNRLTVLANNELNETSIPCGAVRTKADGRKQAQGYFDFFNYAGIHRSVWLMQIPAGAIRDYNTACSLEAGKAEISYEVEAEGDGEILVQLSDREGTPVASGKGRQGILHVENPQLWQVRNAYLYTLTILLQKNGRTIDHYDSPLGIRTVKVEGNHILINGQPVYLKGFGKHEDSEILGRGFSFAVAKRDYECMKWIGANCFRTSHYPYAEEWYQMADQEGFLIIDEVPGVGMMRSFANFAAAGAGKSNGFFGDCPDVDLLQKNHMNAVEEVIRRDKNHPSVIAWSIFNEAETTTQAAHDYFAPLFEAARKLDPQHRPVTGVLEKTSSPERCRCWPMMDFICLNRYYGWYISGGDLQEAKRQFKEEMDQWAEKAPQVPFVFTEFGTDTLDSLHKLPSVMWSQEYQQEYMEMNFSVFDEYPFIQGELAWNFADFQTGQGIMRVNGNKKGLFSRNRQPKEAAWAMKRRWEKQ
ncbi:MAG: beta-glucuronidase [Clostridia bacterium]|nr:beta-glucuronidase [Clostridia bacterium]